MNNILLYLLEAGLCHAMAFLFYRLLLARLTFFHWNRYLLLTLSLLSCVLPLLSFSSPSWSHLNRLQGLPLMPFTLSEVVSTPPAADTMTFAFSDLLILLYFAGAAIFLVRLLIQVLSVTRIIRRGNVQKKDNFYLVNSDDKLPISSFFHYIFLTPQQLSPDEFDPVLQHELIHVRQKHTLDLLFFRLLCVVFWFNPFVYLLLQSMEELHEYLADANATNCYPTNTYARLMLRLATEETHAAYPPIHRFIHVQLKNRIVMLHKSKSRSMEKLKFIFAIPLLGLMFMLFSFDQHASDQQIEDQLTGSWKGTAFTFEQMEGPKISQAMIDGGRSLHIGGTFILKKDKTYEIKDPSGTTNGIGTWKMMNGDVLVLTPDDAEEAYQNQILELTDDKLVTKSNQVEKIPQGNVHIAITLTYQKM